MKDLIPEGEESRKLGGPKKTDSCIGERGGGENEETERAEL